MIEQVGPSPTAVGAAGARASHLVFDGDPKVFDDFMALRLATGSTDEQVLHTRRAAITARLSERFGDDLAMPMVLALRALQILRYRYTEDLLEDAIRRGVGQYVVLGAGLDSFALRRPDLRETLTVFELDQPGPQVWKRTRLQSLGIEPPSNLVLAPIDFETQTMSEALEQNGFQRHKPAFISWLGVTQYLTDEAISSTLQDLASLAEGTEVVFTFVIPRTDLTSKLDQALADMTTDFAAGGEPWLSSHKPAQFISLLEQKGFENIVHFSPDDANEMYFRERPDMLAMPQIEHLMSARVRNH